MLDAPYKTRRHNASMTTPDEAGAATHLARNLVNLRRIRGLTQDGLARDAGVPRSTIANLESGEGNPSLAVLVKVAQALEVPIDELLASPRAMVRHWSADEVVLRNRGRGVTLRPLVPEPVPDSQIDVMEFAPGAIMGGTPHLPGTREYFSCIEGRVRITVAGDAFDVAAGEVLAFPGNLPHSYQNGDGLAPARGVSIVILAKAGV
jgi:XRE family transcriptional regulator, regulator of sulfur utilization